MKNIFLILLSLLILFNCHNKGIYTEEGQIIGLTISTIIPILLIGLVIDIACILACHDIAKKKGYNPAIAAFMGFLFGLVAVFIYAILEKKKEIKNGRD